MDSSIETSSKSWGVESDVIASLQTMGVSEFFPVQQQVIPMLMKFNSQTCIIPRDICVSAPTGSGKTFAYAVPIVSILKKRMFRRLRALIILPSRELAVQVYNVFCALTSGTDLKVINCIGQTDFYEEQQLILGPFSREMKEFDSLEAYRSNNRLYGREGLGETLTNVDIMVCTPGRLIEHIQQTKGFSLKDLKFLVLDEADRLLGNAYHYWVKTLIESTHQSEINASISLGKRGFDTISASSNHLQRLLFSATLTDNPAKLALLGIRNPITIKIRSKLASSIQQGEGDGTQPLEEDLDDNTQYTLPTSLKEHIRVCDTTVRPLHLIGILLEAVGSSISGYSEDQFVDDKMGEMFKRGLCKGEKDMCIVFTSSVDTTHRLARMLQIFNGQCNDEIVSINDKVNKKDLPEKLSAFNGRVAEMSRLMNNSERENIMKDCLKGKIKVLVSSDHMARGIDLPNVKLVINYDQPKYARTYVHRVGRTARANQEGHAVTLLKNGQTGVFKKMRSEISGSSSDIGKCKISKSTIDNAEKLFPASLQYLQPILDNDSI